MSSLASLKIIHPEEILLKNKNQSFADCVILSHDNKILLQKRPQHWSKFGETVNLFGGKVESNETPMEEMIREIKEELGGIIIPSDVIYLGSLTEEITGHRYIIHIYF